MWDIAGKALLIITLTLPPLLFSLWMLFRAVREYRHRICRRKVGVVISSMLYLSALISMTVSNDWGMEF